jgi:hypothetical protein
MKELRVGQVIEHENKRYQILSIKDNLVVAYSYDDNCAIDSTIYIEKTSGRIVATKSKHRKVQQCGI